MPTSTSKPGPMELISCPSTCRHIVHVLYHVGHARALLARSCMAAPSQSQRRCVHAGLRRAWQHCTAGSHKRMHADSCHAHAVEPQQVVLCPLSCRCGRVHSARAHAAWVHAEPRQVRHLPAPQSRNNGQAGNVPTAVRAHKCVQDLNNGACLTSPLCSAESAVTDSGQHTKVSCLRPEPHRLHAHKLLQPLPHEHKLLRPLPPSLSGRCPHGTACQSCQCSSASLVCHAPVPSPDCHQIQSQSSEVASGGKPEGSR
jgi:hypothetical protein